MAGSRADQIADVLGNQLGNPLRIVLRGGLSRQDDDTGVDIVGRQAAAVEGRGDQLLQPRLVDPAIGLVRCRRDR